MKLSVLIALSLALPGAYAKAEVKAVNIDDLLKDAWENSPALKAQKEQTDLAHGDRYRRFIFNEPQFQLASLDDSTGISYGVSLVTAFPGKTFALTTLDTAKAHQQDAEYSAKRHELSRTLASAYLDCASARETTRVQEITSRDLDTLANALRAIYENGRSTQAEKIGAELQASQAKLDLETSRDKQTTACEKFSKTLTFFGIDETHYGPNDFLLPEDVRDDTLIALGSKSADEARSEASVEVAVANRKTAWWSQLPDLTLGASRNHYVYLPASPSGHTWATNLSISFTFPLLFPFHETVEASRARSQAELDRNAAEIQGVQAKSDHDDAAREYRRNLIRLKQVRNKDLPLAQALMDSTYSAYQNGKLGYAEIVLARRTLTDLQNQDIQLRVSVINAHLRCLSECKE